MPDEIKVTLVSSSIAKGKQVTIQVQHERIFEFSKLQVDIVTTSELNPKSVVSKGTEPDPTGENSATISVDTVSLACGIYEVLIVQFHTAVKEGEAERIRFVAGRDFDRALFEVIEPEGEGRTTDELMADVIAREAEIEKQFSAPIEISSGGPAESIEAGVLVFVRNLLIGTRIRFENFEVLPTFTGLDSQDELNFVNAHLRDRTRLGIEFPYTEELKQSSREWKPVCVVHFPNIRAARREDVVDYCSQKTDSILLALSLIRDGVGVVFEIVIVDRKSGKATTHAIRDSYVGNLATGNLAGESAERTQQYIAGMEADPLGAFLVNLYKHARQERNPNFQYLRFWQILEILAANKNYDPNDDLLDYDGQAMMSGSQVRKCYGSVPTVFSLFRDEGIGTTDDTWRKVSIWFAFRSAVAHFGAADRFGDLSRDSFREWGQRGFDEISKSGHDMYLWNLKEDVKLLLMRRLVESAKSP